MRANLEPWRGGGRARAALLGVLASLYRLGWACARLLRRGPPVRVRAAVVSVGNLSVGGTGKSPLARALAARAARQGRAPAILLRGYGARPGPRPLRAGPADAAADVGDEALEHARLAGFPVWVDADRVRAARAALSAGADCLILDDGFQRRWQLGRDLDLLLADFSEIQAGERLLPSGPWREPWSQAARADAVLVSGAPRGLRGRALRAALPEPWRAAPVFRLDREPRGLRAWPSGRLQPGGRLRGRRVLALSGLGRPEAFEATLRGLGARPVPWRFPDHHAFTLAELARLPVPAQAVVTTAKDAARLPRGWKPGPPVYILAVGVVVSPAGPFWRRVDAALRADPRERQA